MKLATPDQMRAIDRTAIRDIGIPGVVLMENAGRATIDQMEKHFGPVCGRTVCLFIGPGNNGGDGLVIARHVFQRGGVPFLVFLTDPAQLTSDAAVNAAICDKIGLEHHLVQQEEDLLQLVGRIRQLHFDHPVHSLVDALFGTGLARTLAGCFAATIIFMNSLARRQRWPLVAVDIPSGLSAQTGKPFGCAIEADLTVTYGLAKPGHYLHGGSTVGKLTVADIAIPKQVIESANLPGELLDSRSTARLLRSRHPADHKGTFGHLLIIAGSKGKTGAAILAARAALHSGCGLVTLAVPASLNPIFEACLPEAMTVPLPCSGSFFSAADYTLLKKLLADKDALVIGPGIGMNPDTGVLVRRLYCELNLPVLMDADALNLLATEPDCITDVSGPRLLTPHPGEMSRLTAQSTADIQADRLQAAGWLTAAQINRDCEIITVLKGAGTVLCSSGGRWAINSSGNSGLATGGMGDVLSGLIGSLLAQRYPLWDAAAVGVFLHGLAADLLAEQQPYGFTASEVAAALPQAIMQIKECSNNIQQRGTTC